ncbi:ribosomal protein L23/L15e core domain-containing protein [Xylaria curta]|nr:ribosomal protein L23/L15e core domain-containing protein [Xylaria curta]
MADSVTLRTRKFQRNPLLARVRVPLPLLVLLDFESANRDWIAEADGCVSYLLPPIFASIQAAAASADIIHPDQAGISKANLQQKLATLYKATPEQVSVFGLRTAFGGGKTTAFACIYDSVEARKKFDAKHRLVRNGLATKPERASRQQRKQRKNRMKTLRGTEKTKGKKAKKDS